MDTDQTVSAEELARICRCDAQTIRKLAREGVISKAKRGHYHLEASIGQYMDQLRQVASGRGASGELESGAHRARLAKTKADLAELQLAEKQGSMVDADQAAEVWAEVVVSAKQELLGLPSRLSVSLPHLSPADIEQLDSEIKATLEGLANGRT